MLADAIGAPYAYWAFGSTAAETYDATRAAGKLSQLPGNNLAYLAPNVATTLRTTIDAVALGAWLSLALDLREPCQLRVHVDLGIKTSFSVCKSSNALFERRPAQISDWSRL